MSALAAGRRRGLPRPVRRLLRASERVPAPLRPLVPLALMGLIFFLSAQPDLTTGLGVWDLIARKIAHAAVFGALCLLWAWAIAPFLPSAALPAAIAIALAYAISDEYHQTFVEGRSGSPLDVVIDAAGIAAAALAVRRIARARP